MLYNTQWEVRADPFSLASLIAWLEKKNPQGKYCFTEAGECLLAQWAASIDPAMKMNGNDNSYGYIVNGEAVNLRHFNDIAFGGEDLDTFGAALQRARAAVQS